MMWLMIMMTTMMMMMTTTTTTMMGRSSVRNQVVVEDAQFQMAQLFSFW